MSADQMSLSQEISAKIYIFLYKGGLKKQDISISVIKVCDIDILPETRDEWNETNRVFADVIEWLQKEGVIYVDKRTHEPGSRATIFEGVQLSSKGVELVARDDILSLMKAEPNGASTNTPESTKFYSNFGELIGGALGSFTKAISH